MRAKMEGRPTTDAKMVNTLRYQIRDDFVTFACDPRFFLISSVIFATHDPLLDKIAIPLKDKRGRNDTT